MKIIYYALFSSFVLVFAARADVTGFGGDGTGWTLNGTGGNPSITADVLTATQTGVFSNATSVWNNTAQPVTANWTATFTYTKTANNSNPANRPRNELIAGGSAAPAYADGFTFTIQEAGLNALGSDGGALGYPNGTVGFALKTTDFGNSPDQGFGFFTSSANFDTSNLGTLDLVSTNAPITITVTYNGASQTLTASATQGNNSAFVQMGIDLASTFGGGGTAFIGFTGGTGALNQTTLISNFNFVTSSLTAPPGNYAVLIKNPSDSGTTKTTGFVRGTLTSAQGLANGGSPGAFTGTVYWQGHPYPVSGGLTGNGTLTKTFAAKNKPQRNLTFFLTRNGALGGIDGTLTDGGVETPFSSYPPVGKVQTGKITGLFFGGNGSPTLAEAETNSPGISVILGIGWFKGTITGDGAVNYNGRMPDGRRFSGSSFVNDHGNFAAYNAFPRYDGLGSFFGAIGISGKGISFNSLRLERPPSHTPRYGNGFNTAFGDACAYYFTPPSGQPIVNFGGGSPNVNLNIFNGNLANTTTPVTYSGADNFVFTSNPLKYKFKTDRANGLFSATFMHPTQGPKKLTGAFVQSFDPNNDVRGAIGNGFIGNGIAGGVFKGGQLAGGLQFVPLNIP